MNRKDFLSAVVPLATAATAFTNQKPFTKSSHLKKIPPYLKKGDTIGICCPSGYISLEECQSAIKKMQEWGFNIRVGTTVGLKDFTFAGSVDARAKDLQEAMQLLRASNIEVPLQFNNFRD